MQFDTTERRRRQRLQKAKIAAERLSEKIKELKTREREARAAIRAGAAKHETWHRMALSHPERLAGFDGEMASARMYLSHLTMTEYVHAVAEFDRPDRTKVDVELAAVLANLEEWTRQGDRLVLERARIDYEAECDSFNARRADTTKSDDWRAKRPTLRQGFLIDRIAHYLEIDAPHGLSRGEAADWIGAHGGNLRLRNSAMGD